MLDIKWWSFKRFKIKSQGGRNWQNWRLELCKCGSAHRLRRYPFRKTPFFFTECSHPWRFPGLLALRPLPGQPNLCLAAARPAPESPSPLAKGGVADRIRRPNRDRAGEQTKAPRHRCSVSAQTQRRPGLTRFVFHLIQYARVFPEGAIPWADQSPSPPHHSFPALQSNWARPLTDRYPQSPGGHGPPSRPLEGRRGYTAPLDPGRPGFARAPRLPAPPGPCHSARHTDTQLRPNICWKNPSSWPGSLPVRAPRSLTDSIVTRLALSPCRPGANLLARLRALGLFPAIR